MITQSTEDSASTTASTPSTILTTTVPTAPSNAIVTAPTATIAWLDRITQASTYKEAGLLAAGVLFLLGYGSVTYNAYHNNLGFIPPLQVQCVLAGIFPTFILIICLSALLVSIKLERRLAVVDTDGIKKLEKSFNSVSSVVIITLIPIAVFVLPKESLLINFLLTIVFASTFFFYLSLSQYFRVRIKEGAFYTRYKFAQAYGFLSMLFICMSFWLRILYPHLPQEFGGMQPRLAYVAVTRAQLSPEMRLAVMPATTQKLSADPAKDPLAVAQTVLLDVVYENSDALFVRVHDNKSTLPDQPPTVYQIKKSGIQGVTWRGFGK